jgi:hypothetical protein
MAGRAKPHETEKELQAEIQLALGWIAEHALQIARVAHHNTMLGDQALGVQPLGRDLGVLARHVQALRAWETKAMDAYKALVEGAR